jgi:antitoxin component YwqK of YwqJK toxin-antitoxin module
MPRATPSLLSLLLFGASSAYAGNSAEEAQAACERDYLLKVNFECGLSLTVKYDGESLRKNNKDIGWDQTGGSNECNEPLRYVWHACKSEKGKAALKRTKLSAIVCKGTAAAKGSLTLKGGTVTVERAFEEDKPYVRSKKQFEAALDFALPLETEDPYYDDKWNALKQQDNPVTNTQTFCLVNGTKVELRPSLEDPFERREEDGTVKCMKDGQPFTDLVVKKGKKTGFLTQQRDAILMREQYRDGKRDGEQRTTNNGRLTGVQVYVDGKVVTDTDYHPNGKLSRHTHQFPDRLDLIELSDDGKVYAITCSPLSKDDRELRKWCGFEGAITHTLYDGTGKVSRVQTYLNGVLQKEGPGNSDYGSGNEVAYQDGKKHGQERVVDKTGKLLSTTQWNRGLKDGKELTYADDGKKVAKESVWKADELVQATEFYLNGNPKLREVYDTPKKLVRTRYWDTGKTKEEGTLLACDSRGFRSRGWCEEGTHKRFYENGDRAAEENYRAGKLHGTSKSWWDNGRQEEVAEYEDGKVSARKNWDRDGKLTVDEEYEADGSRKLKR